MTVREVAQIVEGIAQEPRILRVDDLARRLGLGVRRLQRLFTEYVGIGPKQVIRRYRLHEAAERVTRTRRGDWSLLAAELGYSDQAHFIRDFRRTIGLSPGRYAASDQAVPEEAAGG